MTDPIPRLNAALEGRYSIERELGEGGMATVYLARDEKHKRNVALKVLKPELAAVVGAERFLAEIKTTANLQHPHILPLFDSGEADGFLFYVMPYVEGESLREKLDRERQLPVEEAVRIATDVAEALHSAHEQGVIHRDIKPANILLSKGRPLVADFGIALAVSAAGGGRLTETGLSLGTPFYMSPEQATGDQHIGPRSDIYALGCVLFEMLAGEPPFTGSTPQAVLGKIISGAIPSVTTERPSVPPNVAAAIQQSLERVPADRFTTAARFAEALRESDWTPPRAARSRPAPSMRVALGLAVLGWAAAALLLAVLVFEPSSDGARFSRLSISLPAELPLSFSGPSPLGIWQKALDITRDGDAVVFVTRTGGSTQLAVRRMNEPAVTLLPETEGAYHPFFSPDGEWVGFFVGTDLLKVRTSGEPGATTLSTGLSAPVGAAWGDDGRIFVANGEGGAPAWVPEAGGARQRIGNQPTPINSTHLLPGGEWVLTTVWITGQLALYSTRDNTVHAITRRGVTTDSLPVSDWLVGYSPVYSETGHILYLAPGDGGLMALPFDADARRVLGDPRPVLSDVRKEETYGFGHVALSESGTLVYASGGNMDIGHLAIVGRDQSVDTLPFERDRYEAIRMSPDGGSIAVTIRDEIGLRTPHILDLVAGRLTERIAEGMANTEGWTASGDSLLLGDVFGGNWFLPDVPTLPKTVFSLIDGSMTPLGYGSSLFLDHASPSGVSAWMAWGPRQYAKNASAQDSIEMPRGVQPDVSPDGRWLAYLRFSDGVVVVSPIPPTGREYVVSRGRGEQPQWFADGSRLAYRFGRDVWEVDVSTEGQFRSEEPRLFARGPFSRVWFWSYDVTPDGRLLVMLGPPEESTDRIEVVTDISVLLGG